MVDACCSKCGKLLVSYLTQSGDVLITEPCPNECSNAMADTFTTDEDFEEGRVDTLKTREDL